MNAYTVETRDPQNIVTAQTIQADWYEWKEEHVTFCRDRENTVAKRVASFASHTVMSVKLKERIEYV